VDARLYVVRGGRSWRALPHDDPPWQTVDDDFQPWSDDATRERIHQVPQGCPRLQLGRQPQPSAAIIDRQSVMATETGGPEVTTATIRLTGTDALSWSISRAYCGTSWRMPPAARTGTGAPFPRLAHRWVDIEYQGGRVRWVEATLAWRVAVGRKPRRWGDYPADAEPPPRSAGGGSALGGGAALRQSGSLLPPEHGR